MDRHGTGIVMSTNSFSTAGHALRPLLALALAGIALSGCGETRRAIGLDRTSPDEFAVVSRAPLTLPPNMAALPPPRPGAARPQERTATQTAAASVFGSAPRASAAGRTTGEQALIAQAGAKGGIEPGIRTKLDQETTDLIIADRRWIDTLLFWQKQEAPFTVVDPAKEQQRLRQAEAQGKPLNDGTVPTIERKRKAPLEDLF